MGSGDAFKPSPSGFAGDGGAHSHAAERARFARKAEGEALIPILDELANWARWLKRIGDCYPDGWLDIAGSIECAQAIPYRNGDTSVAEKLARVEREIPPDEWAAERIERWVRQLHPLHGWAVRIQWVTHPEETREAIAQTHDQWQAIRARFLARTMEQQVNVREYEEAVDEATQELERMLCQWARGV